MIVGCWSPKGGSGTSVVAAGLAVLLAREHAGGALLVDLGGDAHAILGLTESTRVDLADWTAAVRTGRAAVDALAGLETRSDSGALAVLALACGPAPIERSLRLLCSALAGDTRPVVIDIGLVSAGPPGEARSTLVAACDRSLLVIRPCYLALRRATALGLDTTGVVVVSEPSRALRAKDVAEALDLPVLAEVPVDPAIARAVDAGLLAQRLPRSLARGLRHAS